MSYIISALFLVLLVVVLVLSVSAFKAGRKGMKESKSLEPQNFRIFGREWLIKDKTAYWLSSVIHFLCGLYVTAVVTIIFVLIFGILIYGRL
ncbi:MAG: hypothetical protein FWG90_03520 [Oscillospiraceae bacterium]|nr:hypothetical protein [Oscillospiraceae bacterium]